jgi:hypothetical protein
MMSIYLLSLRERGGRNHRKQKNVVERSPKVGEIVVIKNEGTPRGLWKMGRVNSLVTGSDGMIRSANVVLGNGYVIRRACSHLYPLELYTETDSGDRTLNQDSQSLDEVQELPEGGAAPPPDDVALSEDDYGLFSQEDLDRLQGFLDQVDDRLADVEDDDWDQSSSAIHWD